MHGLREAISNCGSMISKIVVCGIGEARFVFGRCNSNTTLEQAFTGDLCMVANSFGVRLGALTVG